jgi:hypothetical protein
MEVDFLAVLQYLVIDVDYYCHIGQPQVGHVEFEVEHDLEV